MLKQEDLVLAFPLIALCSTYAFFKYIPFNIGVPGIVVLSALIQVRAKLAASKQSAEHIDKTIVKDLVSDEDALLAKSNEKAIKKQRKQQQKVHARLKEERRRKNGGNKENADDDDEDELLANIAKKGSRKNR